MDDFSLPIPLNLRILCIFSPQICNIAIDPPRAVYIIRPNLPLLPDLALQTANSVKKE